MHCDKCGKNEATIHFSEIIKDVKSELHLCEGCARGIGINPGLSKFSLSVPEMLSFLDPNEVDMDNPGPVCAGCGYSSLDFRQSGHPGCPECYTYLKDSLVTVIRGFHGYRRHVGKNPRASLSTDRKEKPRETRRYSGSLDELKNRLEQAVQEERYEDAAILRDEISACAERVSG